MTGFFPRAADDLQGISRDGLETFDAAGTGELSLSEIYKGGVVD